MTTTNSSSDLFLVQKTTGDEERFAVRLKLGDQILGRSVDSDIFLSRDTISRAHARLSVVQMGVVVTDLGSRNGTWVNRKRVHCVSVFPGEEIQFGTVVMMISRDPGLAGGGGTDLETQDARGVQEPTLQPELVALTPAQQRVLELFKAGLMEKQVADHLQISIHTVHNHAKRIYRAYGVSTRVELLLKLLPRRENGESD